MTTTTTVGAEVRRLRIEIAARHAEIAALAPIINAAAQLRDACTWQRNAACESDDDAACEALDRAIDAVCAAVDARQAGEPPPSEVESLRRELSNAQSYSASLEAERNEARRRLADHTVLLLDSEPTADGVDKLAEFDRHLLRKAEEGELRQYERAQRLEAQIAELQAQLTSHGDALLVGFVPDAPAQDAEDVAVFLSMDAPGDEAAQ